MKIVVLVGSPRKMGNTEILADSFIKGSESAGNEVVKIHVKDFKVNPCIACDYCMKHSGECIQKDDMQKIYTELYHADMVVFASPVYFFGLSAQIKAIIDRFYSSGMKPFPIQSSALLLVYEDDTAASSEASIMNYKALLTYAKWENKGIIHVGKVLNKGDILGNKGIEEAETLGLSVN